MCRHRRRRQAPTAARTTRRSSASSRLKPRHRKSPCRHTRHRAGAATWTARQPLRTLTKRSSAAKKPNDSRRSGRHDDPHVEERRAPTSSALMWARTAARSLATPRSGCGSSDDRPSGESQPFRTDLASFTGAGYGTFRVPAGHVITPGQRVALIDDEADAVEAIVLSVDGDKAYVRAHWPGTGGLSRQHGAALNTDDGEGRGPERVPFDSDIADAALVLSREQTDTGHRASLDDASPRSGSPGPNSKQRSARSWSRSWRCGCWTTTGSNWTSTPARPAASTCARACGVRSSSLCSLTTTSSASPHRRRHRRLAQRRGLGARRALCQVGAGHRRLRG